MPVSQRPTDRILYPWPLVQLGAFDCWPDDPRWRTENCVEEGHVIAFPGRSVEIAQVGDRPRVMDPNRIVFYNRLQTYRRAPVSRDGDHCSYLVVAPSLIEELVRRGAAPARDVESRPFPVSAARSEAADYVEMHAIRRRLAAADELEIQERLLRLVERVLRRLAGTRAPGDAARAATLRARDDLAEAARARLARRLHRRQSLEEVAAGLEVSVYHLARVFRAATGMGLHAYRDQLRLRVALDEVLAGEAPLTQVALDAGYAGSSHFTDRFRAVFGRAPSRLRREVGAGRSF